MRRDTGTSGQGTAARRGRWGQPVCTDLTSDPMQRSNSALATVALWESGCLLRGLGADVVQQEAISLFTQSPADDGFDRFRSWQFQDFQEYFKVDKLVIGHFFQKVTF